MSATAEQKKQSFITQSSESPSSYPTEDVLLKQMSYDPSLVPMGLEEDSCFETAEDTENEAEDEDY